MELYTMALFDLLFRRADIEFPPRAGDRIQFMQNDFDAILSDISWGYGTSVIGTIRGDKKGRFMDGRRVHTPEIQEVYIVTRNSIYKVEDGSWAPRPRGARGHAPMFGQFDYRDPREALPDPREGFREGFIGGHS